MEGSLRGAKDGITYLGCSKSTSNNKYGNSQIINDFIFPQKDENSEKRYRGRHLKIEYSIELK